MVEFLFSLNLIFGQGKYDTAFCVVKPLKENTFPFYPITEQWWPPSPKSDQEKTLSQAKQFQRWHIQQTTYRVISETNATSIFQMFFLRHIFLPPPQLCFCFSVLCPSQQVVCVSQHYCLFQFSCSVSLSVSCLCVPTKLTRLPSFISNVSFFQVCICFRVLCPSHSVVCPNISLYEAFDRLATGASFFSPLSALFAIEQGLFASKLQASKES